MPRLLVAMLVPMSRHLKGLAILLAALVLSAGCASQGTVRLGPAWAPKLTADELAEAHRIEVAIDRMCAEIIKAGNPCTKPYLSVLDRKDLTAVYSPAYNSLTVPRDALGEKAGVYWRAVVAHELGHWAWADARLTGDLVKAERNANAHAVHVLVAGFDYTEREAVAAVWRYLVAGVKGHAKPTKGHPDACAELHDFEQRAGVVTPYACEEKAA